MMKNKKSRSVIFRSINITQNLGTNNSLIKNSQENCPPVKNVVTYYPREFPNPNKGWNEYLTERPIVDGNNLKLKFRSTPYSKPDIKFVERVVNVQNPAGIYVTVYFIPKDKKIEDMVRMRVDTPPPRCIYSGPMIGDEKVVYVNTTTTIKDISNFPNNIQEYLDHTVKNNGYSVGGNKRLYITIKLEYRDSVFAFYVD